MPIVSSLRQGGASTSIMNASAKISVGVAVGLALYGIPHSAAAVTEAGGEQQASQSATLQEVVVTASKRKETIEAVPYSITAISGDSIARTGATDLVSFAKQVPGLSLYDIGARDSATVYPIIRGINASAANNGALRTFEQAPVGIYIGNSPASGYLELNDISRVEVLKGPQGTLYGAGALSGALRVIPNDPQLNAFSADAEVGTGDVAHANQPSYTASGMLNVPVGQTVAARLAAKYDYEPGFINIYGLLKRSGGGLYGVPVLANPSDPINSSGVFYGINDYNWEETVNVRGSLLWKPADVFQAELAFSEGHLVGEGGPENSSFPGGAYPLDPRIDFPRGGPFQAIQAVDAPYSRTTRLTSLDLSYDAGFATLSSTTSYLTNSGSDLQDVTYFYGSQPTFTSYYAGNPVDPRLVAPQLFEDEQHSFSQEVRLISRTGPEKRFDYVLGLFYQRQTSSGSWTVTDPGSPERSVAMGCTAPYYLGATFPNCLVQAGPRDLALLQTDSQLFEDKSVYGEIAWHLTDHLKATFGGRHFDQNFVDFQGFDAYAFGLALPGSPRRSPASKNIWKVDLSYEYGRDQYVYALWSQGFRRGGANALSTTGAFAENPVLLAYVPDTTDNYEVGVKGRFRNGASYAFDVFDIEWHNPQVEGQTPSGDFAVWNAKQARSKGVELSLDVPLPVQGLSFNVGGSYERSEFTENYLIPADSFGNIAGSTGQQLPGSPKASAAATITYSRTLFSSYGMTMALNDTYRSAMPLSTFPILGVHAVPTSPGMTTINFSDMVSNGSWRVGLYVTNALNNRVVQVPILNSDPAYGGGSVINQPREIALRVGYTWD